MTDQTDYQSFYDTIENDPAAQARLEQAVTKVQISARELGADISQEEAVSLPTVRLAATTDGWMDEDTLNGEMNNLAAVRAAKRQSVLRSELASGKSDALEAVNRLPPAERLNWSRANLPQERPDSEPQKLTPEEEGRVIKGLEGLPSHIRMTVGRKHGLGV